MKNLNTPEELDASINGPKKKPAIGKIQKKTHDDVEDIDVV
jgi:hypothetical protein